MEGANGDVINLGILSPYNDPQVPSDISMQYYDDLPSIDEIENILSMTEDIADAADGCSFVMPPASSPANADGSNGISILMPLPISPANSVVSPGNADAANGIPFQVPPATSFGTNMVTSQQNANVANRMPPASSRGTNVALSPGYADMSNGIPIEMPPASSSGTVVPYLGNADMVNGISFPMTTASTPATNISQSCWNAEMANGISFQRPHSPPANMGFPPASAHAANGVSFMVPPGIPPVRRLVHGPAWSIEWSRQEQAILNRGLQEFTSDPVIAKYTKIAARLASKTVRDVAMRCYWMKKREHERRQRAEGMHMGRNMIDREERLASSSLGAHNCQLIQSASPSSQPMMHDSQTNRNPERLASSSLGVHNNHQTESSISQPVMQNLPTYQFEPIYSEENHRILAYIAGNIGTGQIQQNRGLFNRVGSTIGSMLHGMDEAAGSSMNMPPLPVSMNVDLFNTMWPNFSRLTNSSRNPNLSEVPRRQSG